MSKKWNFDFFTLGGCQYWRDIIIYSGWRIQQNCWSKKCRILDPWDVRRANGTYDDCIEQFEEIKKTWEIETPSGDAVVLLHGLGRTKNSFKKLELELLENGYKVVNINYPSLKYGLKENSLFIKEVIENLKGYNKISFVGHSMGCIIIRELLKKDFVSFGNMKLDKIVMLAPPNQGSKLANKLKKVLPIRFIMGQSLDDMSKENAENFPPISKETNFGIIAGARDNEKGYNPFLKQDNDGIVTVEETKLDGASDFIIVNALHSFIMQNPQVIKSTLRFLQTGKFGKGKRPKKQSTSVNFY